MLILFAHFSIIWTTILVSSETDAQPDTHGYPKDDYGSVVNFSLAEPVTLSDIKFVHFDIAGIEVDASKLKDFPTKIFIHGWLTSIEKSPWYPQLRDAYLQTSSPTNVIFVDYESIASKPYTIAAPTSMNVAKVVADYLLNTNINLDNIHIIGHSLGSHVAGFIGRHIYSITNKKVGRITLLDPAGPKFDKVPNKVNKDDAQFLDVIHTDDGHYGLNMSVGHIDVFPNGGTHPQPGCPSYDVDDNCSHARSTKYFVESVLNKQKICRLAASWKDFQAGVFLDKQPEYFGEHVPHSARGNYYCNTNSSPPYLNTFENM